MINYNLRKQWQDKSVPYSTFVLFHRPLASFKNNIIYIDWMAVSSQGNFFSWMAKLLAIEAIKAKLNYEFQHSYAAWNPTGGISHLSRSSRQEF